MTPLFDRAEWMDDAACNDTDPDLFFADGAGGHAVEAVAAAKAVCRGCDVRAECLDHAIANHENFGVWGGTTEHERRRIRRQRALRAQGLTIRAEAGRRLSNGDKDEIAARYTAGEATQMDLAAEYGVSQNTISVAVRARCREEAEAVRVGAQVLDLMEALRERTAG